MAHPEGPEYGEDADWWKPKKPDNASGNPDELPAGWRLDGKPFYAPTNRPPDGIHKDADGTERPFWLVPEAELQPGMQQSAPQWAGEIPRGAGQAIIIGPGKEIVIPEPEPLREERERKERLKQIRQPEAIDGIPRYRLDANFLASIVSVLKNIHNDWGTVAAMPDRYDPALVRISNLIKNLECREDAAREIGGAMHRAQDDWVTEFRKSFASKMNYYSWTKSILAGHGDADKLLRGDPEVIDFIQKKYQVSLGGLLSPVNQAEAPNA